MKNILFIIIGLLGFVSLSQMSAQTVQLNQVTQLPTAILETSGLENSTTPNTFWSHNDRNNPAEIFQFDLNGNLLKTLEINQNVDLSLNDFEDMARDNAGNLYVGDIGDNFFSKTTYRVFKVNNPEAIANGTLVNADVIEFTYPNGAKYNSEAMIWYEGYIYIFVKGEVRPVGTPNNQNFNDPNQITKSFRVPDQAGTYEAEFLEDFTDPNFSPVVTGADISPDGETLLLMGYEKFFVIQCLEAPYFFANPTWELRNFTRPIAGTIGSQSEAVVFKDNDNIYITDEQKLDANNNPIYRNLYTYNINGIINNGNFNCAVPTETCGMVINPYFNDGLNDWIPSAETTTSNVNFTVVNGEMQCSMDDGSDAKWKVRLKQNGMNLIQGETYEISFDAYANANRIMNVLSAHTINGTYYGYFYTPVNLTTTKTHYTYTFTMTEADDADARLHLDMGQELNSTVWIDNVCFEEISETCGNLQNSSFSDGTTNWELYVHGDATGTTWDIVNGEAVVDIPIGTDKKWKVELIQYLLLEQGKTYEISFEAYANFDREISVNLANNENNYIGYFYEPVDITTTKTTYTHIFTMTQSDDPLAYLHLNLGQYDNSIVYLDNICLEEIPCPNTLNLNDLMITGGTYEAASEIHSNSSIETNSNVIYSAKDCINLEGDFEVKANSEFEINMDGCP